MTQRIDTISQIASQYDVIVFDQWGVLHNGTTPYPGAIAATRILADTTSCAMAVLSNSGKRAAPNAARIAAMGFDDALFDHVMTSGEALWRDVEAVRIKAHRFFPVEREKGDAAAWAEGLPVELTDEIANAQAILMMGLPDDVDPEDWNARLRDWRARGLPMYCSNPDKHSPRADRLVASPGLLAHTYRSMGGETMFYGKPHRPVFRALEEVFCAGRYLMVGDSMEHDIAGAHAAGWDSLLIEGGLYGARFAEARGEDVLSQIIAETRCAPPTFRIKGLC